MDLKSMRLDYQKSKIDFEDLDANPISFFLKWFNEVLEVNKNEALQSLPQVFIVVSSYT